MVLLFLDFEASSLLPGSYPIEIAWVFEDGTSESHLIRPTEAWLDCDRGNPGWSKESEDVHGIALSTLMEFGEPVERVAAIADAAVSPLSVLTCSDAPLQDGYWLRRLFEAGGIRHDVTLINIQDLYAMTCRPLLDLVPGPNDPDRWRVEQRLRNLCAEIIEGAEEAEHVCHRKRHRALPDAQALWRTYIAVQTEVGRQFREAG